MKNPNPESKERCGYHWCVLDKGHDGPHNQYAPSKLPESLGNDLGGSGEGITLREAWPTLRKHLEKMGGYRIFLMPDFPKKPKRSTKKN